MQHAFAASSEISPLSTARRLQRGCNMTILRYARRASLGWVIAAGGAFVACGGGKGEANPTPGPVEAVGPDSGASSPSFPTRALECGGADCGEGACIDGACCKAESVCGTACCAEGSACLFDRCVQPGHECRVSVDCAANEYCETAFGAGSKPSSGVDAGAQCTSPPPTPGRCAPRPSACDPNRADPNCIAACEYRPPAEEFRTVKRWEWGFGLSAAEFPNDVDVWATPVVGKIYDGNCDGNVDALDAPSIVFVSANSVDEKGQGTCCQCGGGAPAESACHRGVLRAVDGRTGKTVWSLDKASPNSLGFAGMSPALADIDGDGRGDIVTVTGEGYVVVVDGNGRVKEQSDQPIPNATNSAFGWGGGLAVADVDGDGQPEVAYGAVIFSRRTGALRRVYVGNQGQGGRNATSSLSTFADVDGVPGLELLAGRTAYRHDGTSWGILWDRAEGTGASNVVGDGFSAIADFDGDGSPEAVLVSKGTIYLLDAESGRTLLGPHTLHAASGDGGPPTVADFDGDGRPEIGVAMQNRYVVVKANFTKSTFETLWTHENHDLSSSVTGSTVFDFEGDGQAEVVYADECYLWVWGYDRVAKKPVVRFATPHTSFTATEAPVVADVDGDGHAEIVAVSNRADPVQWKCNIAPWNEPDAAMGRPAWRAPEGQPAGTAYRGIAVYGDQGNSWVGTRSLWGQHTYHVSEICDDGDGACVAPNRYASVPRSETPNWKLPWLNNFRQNVQEKGIFDAPDAIVGLAVDCSAPLVARVTVRNIGLKALPPGVEVGVFDPQGKRVGSVTTSRSLASSQTERLVVTLDPEAEATARYVAKVVLDPRAKTFHQCREDNDESQAVVASCVR